MSSQPQQKGNKILGQEQQVIVVSKEVWKDVRTPIQDLQTDVCVLMKYTRKELEIFKYRHKMKKENDGNIKCVKPNMTDCLRGNIEITK